MIMVKGSRNNHAPSLIYMHLRFTLTEICGFTPIHIPVYACTSTFTGMLQLLSLLDSFMYRYSYMYIYMCVYIRCTWCVLHTCIFIRRNHIFAGKHTKGCRSRKCARNYGVKTNPLLLWHDRVVCT